MHEVQKKFLQKYQRDCRKNKIYLLRSSSKFRPFGYIPGNITVLNTPLDLGSFNFLYFYQINRLDLATKPTSVPIQFR